MTGKRTGRILFVLIAVTAGTWATAWGSNDGGTWLKTFEGVDYGAFFDVTLAGDDALLAVGTTYHPLLTTTRRGDVLVAMLTLDGDPIWEKTYGGDATEQAFRVEATEDGGFLVLAETDSFGAGERDLYVLRLDESGELIWEKTYGGSGTEWAKDLIRTSDGGFLLVGETDSFGESFDAYVVKVDESGAVLWEATLGGDDNETGIAALEAENGDLIVLAGVSYAGGYEGTRRDSRLFRLDSDGSEIWSTLYHADVKQWGNDMVFSPDGDVVIVGISEPVGGSEEPLDSWIAKASAGTGELEWSAQEGSQYQDDYGLSVVATPGGEYLVAGFGPALPVMRFDDTGNVHWVRDAVAWQSWTVFGGFSILGLSDGTFIVSGWIYIRRTGDDFDAILARIDAEGRIEE